MKNEKNEKEVKIKTKDKIRAVIVAIVVMAIIWAAVFIISEGETRKGNKNNENGKAINLTSDIEVTGIGAEDVGMIPCRRFGDSVICDSSFVEPTPIQTPKQNGASIKGIIIDPSMTLLPTPVPTLITKGGPVILTIESPQKILVGDEFTANITINPAGNKIVGIQLNIVFSKLVAETIELSEESDPTISVTGDINNEAEIIGGVAGMPAGTFPNQPFLFATVKFSAIEKGEGIVELRQIKVLDEKGNFVYLATNAQTIQIG